MATGKPQSLIQIVQLSLQPCNVGLDAGTDGDGGGAQAVLLRDQHGHHLVPAGSQGVKGLRLDISQMRNPVDVPLRRSERTWGPHPDASVVATINQPPWRSPRTWKMLTTPGTASAAKAASPAALPRRPMFSMQETMTGAIAFSWVTRCRILCIRVSVVKNVLPALSDLLPRP